MDGLKYEESFFSVDKEGRVALVCLQREGLQLKMWTWKDNERLPDARVLMLQQPYQRKSEIDVVYTCIGENSGTLLIKDNHRRLYAADINTCS
jgi:hypothetical protein